MKPVDPDFDDPAYIYLSKSQTVCMKTTLLPHQSKFRAAFNKQTRE